MTETAAAGQLVGDPVTADDDNAADVLTYTLVEEVRLCQFRYRPGHGSDQRGQERGVQRQRTMQDITGVDANGHLHCHRHCHRP